MTSSVVLPLRPTEELLRRELPKFPDSVALRSIHQLRLSFTVPMERTKFAQEETKIGVTITPAILFMVILPYDMELLEIITALLYFLTSKQVMMLPQPY